MTELLRPTAKVLFRVPGEGGSADVETLWAHDLGADQYRIDNCPFFAYGVSWNDVVYAPYNPDEQFPTFQKVLSKSGNRTIRLILDPPASANNESEKTLNNIVSLGCSYEAANGSYIALNIPPSIKLTDVIDSLRESGVKWEHADPTYDELHPNEMRQS